MVYIGIEWHINRYYLHRSRFGGPRSEVIQAFKFPAPRDSACCIGRPDLPGCATKGPDLECKDVPHLCHNMLSFHVFSYIFMSYHICTCHVEIVNQVRSSSVIRRFGWLLVNTQYVGQARLAHFPILQVFNTSGVLNKRRGLEQLRILMLFLIMFGTSWNLPKVDGRATSCSRCC